MPPRRSSARGIALMEVLVAVTLLGIGIGVALGSLSNSARIHSRLAKKTVARELAQGQLVRLQAAGALSRPGLSAGTFDSPNQAYHWKLRVEASLVNQNRRRVQLSILPAGGDAALYTSDTYVLD